MHDYHAVKALVARLLRDADPAQGVQDVGEVRIRASPIYSAAALRQAYAVLTAGTPLAGSRLEVEDLPDRRECARCGSAYAVAPQDVAGHLVVCPHCGEPSPLEVGTGLEIVGVTRAG